MRFHYICLRYFAFYLTILFPTVATARPLPMCPFKELVQASQPDIPVITRQMVMVPLAIRTVLDTSQIFLGRRQFFRVTEDVVVDGVLVFGAGAVACGRISSIERDRLGRCLSVGITILNVQATDGRQVMLDQRKILIKLEPTKAPGSLVRMNAEVIAFIAEENSAIICNETHVR